MPEYVYALHDFTPEHEDEINFKAGDRIEVIEKDDLYGDGWWQGCNLSGKIGLFPQSYTSATAATAMPIPEIHTPKLHPLKEESLEDIAALTPEPKPATLPTDGSPSPSANNNANDTVMSATLNDVQRAIEQLAARRDTDDTSRSFSFVSTNHDTESESEAAHEDDEQHQWHKDARKALAERAQLENVRKKEEEEEAMRLPPPPLVVIPIEAEFSDESDGEGEDDEEDDHDSEGDQRDLHHPITETDTTLHTDVTVVPQPLPPLVSPVPEAAQLDTTPTLVTLTATATSTSFTSSPDDTVSSSAATSVSPSTSLSVAADIPLPKSPSVPANVTPTPTITTPQLSQNLIIQTARQPEVPPSTPTPVGTTVPQSAVTITPYNTGLSSVVSNHILPSTMSPPIHGQEPSSTIPVQTPVQVGPQPTSSPVPVPVPLPATTTITQLPQPASHPTQPVRPSSPPPSSVPSAFKQTHPSEWTVEQVVEWLKNKGIDETTCSKFIEHEITGDVLLELDTAMLKDEMGIVALGKRIRIQNGIVELKRPISTNITSMPMPFSNTSSTLGQGMMGDDPNTTSPSVSGLSNTGGIQQQQMYNFNGIPVPGTQQHAVYAAQTTMAASPALSGSFNSGYGGYAYSGGGGSGRTAGFESPITMPGNGSPYAGSVASEEHGHGLVKDTGLQPPKPRPANLKLSPSDGALGAAAAAIELSPTHENDAADKDEDKGVQSEPDLPLPANAISTKKRRLFGLSTESGASSGGSRKSGDSKDKDKSSTPTTPRSGSIRIGRPNSNVLSTAGAALRSRSPTPVGVRKSGESTGTNGANADDSLVVVSATSSPSHLGVGGKHAKNKKSFDGGLASVFGRDKSVEPKEREKEKTKASSDRSSFFGSGMSLGKSRKPAPRYSLYDADTMATGPTSVADKHRSISRYLTSSIRLGSSESGGKKNARPGTAPSGKVAPPFGSTSSNVPPSTSTARSPPSPTTFRATSKDDTHITPSSPSTPTGTVLRKRHVSTGGPAPLPPTTLGSASKKNASPNENGNGTNGKTLGANAVTGPSNGKAGKVDFQAGLSVLDQIGQPDHAGWLKKKGEKYNAWKTRYLVLKGPHLYYLKNADRTATKIKGYVKVQGYKIIADETGPGKYGFKIVHETEPTHYFSSEELLTTREWMKALMKATIERDYSKPVISSCNIPTIPLVVAQTMSPGPRPPSPAARDATQRALRRENPNQLSSRDARILMGLPSTTDTTDDSKSIGNGENHN